MALSGEFYGSTSNGFIKPKISWQAQQFPEENYSLVTATLTYSRTNTGYVTSGTWAGSLTIGEDTKWESRYLSISYDSNTVAISHTARVDHDAYGSAKVQIRAAGSIPETSLENTSISQTIEPDVIPLASTVAATDAFVEAVCMVAVSRKNAAYTHSIALSCNGYEGYLTADGKLTDTEQFLTETAVAFTVPTWFYDLMPQSPSAKVRLTCRTYNGQIPVGFAQEAEFTITARESLCAPEAKLTVEDVAQKTLALTGDSGVLIRYASTARCVLSATGKNGAGITSKKIGDEETDMREFPEVENDTFTAFVTDTRGYTTQVQAKLPIVPYIQLTVNASVKRTDPTSGKAVLRVWGNYFSDNFGAEENSLTLTCQVGSRQIELAPVIGAGSYCAEVLVEGLDYTATHILVVTGQDAVMEVSADVVVKPGIPVFDWGQKDFAFHVPVYAEGGLQVEGKQLWEHIYPVGSIYMSVVETEPSVLFGGKWEQLKDRFLLACGDRYSTGQTGGEEQHTLLVSELPAHSHNLIRPQWYLADGDGEKSTVYDNNWGSIYGTTATATKTYLDINGASMEQAGGGMPHNNMPPFLAVYMWKRVA
jgi:hypothetical protein